MSFERTLLLSNRNPRLTLERRELERAIAVLDLHRDRFLGGCPPGELSIAFLTDPDLAKLHGQFLDDPTETDVITFEGAGDLGVAGEICVSADAARRQGADPRRELTLYVVHGWLHLAGYDDLKPAAKKVMRRAESRALRLLEAERAVPRFRIRAFSVRSRKRET